MRAEPSPWMRSRFVAVVLLWLATGCASGALRDAKNAYNRGDFAAAEAAARYWPGAEAEFWSRFRLLDRTAQTADAGFDQAAARTAFLSLARDTYETVTASVTRTQRGAKAVSNARTELFGGIRKKPASPQAG